MLDLSEATKVPYSFRRLACVLAFSVSILKNAMIFAFLYFFEGQRWLVTLFSSSLPSGTRPA